MPQKRVALFLVCLMVIVSVTSKGLAANSDVIKARSAILTDFSGAVLFEQNCDSPIAPASLTKILTLYLVLEAVQAGRVRLSDNVRISRKAAGAPPTRMGLKAGEAVPLSELIKGAAVASGNDAAITLAEYVGGTEERFIALMNLKAKQLGMWHSHFVNPNGLPAKSQFTTARDMAKLSLAYLRRFPQALTVHSLQKYSYKKVTRRNANKLLSTYPGVDGLKTGFVNASRYNISVTAAREGKRLVAVVLGAATPGTRTRETARLLDYGFTGVLPKAVTMAKTKSGKPVKKTTKSTKSSKRKSSKKSSGSKKK